ncbi:Zinc-binding domain [Halocaridina rubra]|uniref:Zinc-binding domain n=1 Tax=Halocaridina rubra TaxID=373956 RepID=A0AAN8WTN1_HALRR
MARACLCNHCWTSMNGLVLFFYIYDSVQDCGHVRFSLKGQKCNQCTPPSFETPMWYPEEVQKVMTNLYYEVANNVYGFQTPPTIKNRRHGRPRANHNAKMCQGCHQGYCLRNKDSLAAH